MAQCHSRFCLGIPYVHECKTWGDHERFLCSNFHLIALWISFITKILGYSTPSKAQLSLTLFYVVAEIIWRNGSFLSIVWHKPTPYKTEFRTIENKYYVKLPISSKPKILYDIHIMTPFNFISLSVHISSQIQIDRSICKYFSYVRNAEGRM